MAGEGVSCHIFSGKGNAGVQGERMSGNDKVSFMILTCIRLSAGGAVARWG